MYPIGLLAGGAGAPYKRFAEEEDLGARGAFTVPSIKIPKGGGRLRRPKPKIEGTVKIDLSSIRLWLLTSKGVETVPLGVKD